MDISVATFLYGTLPLTHNMTFFSDHYKNCTIRASGWCNIPNKTRFSEATEQMIVAYHKGIVVYAYKGLLNRNIDYNWSGAILLDFVKIVDKCTSGNGVQPTPEKIHYWSHFWLGFPIPVQM